MIGLVVIILLISFSITVYLRQITIPTIKFDDNITVGTEHNNIYYPVYSANPFHDDLMWVSAYHDGAWRNRKQYLFDLRQEKLIATASPNTDVITSRKHAVTVGSVITDWRYIMRARVERWLLMEGPPHNEPVSRLFVMNNETGEQRDLLNKHFLVYIDHYEVSPDGQYFYCTSYSPNGISQHIVDLENQSLKTISDTINYQTGWWSNKVILMKNRQYDVVVFNVETEEQRLVFSSQNLLQYIQNQNLHLTQKNMYDLIHYWDGTEYQFLVASYNRFPRYPDYKPPNPKEMWLIKINKDTMGFETVSTDFPFQETGYWNQDLSKYVFTEKLEDGSRELKLYDLPSNTTQSLLPDDTHLSSESRAGFYHDRIVFNTHKNLWVINQDGSGLRQLFPPVTETNPAMKQK